MNVDISVRANHVVNKLIKEYTSKALPSDQNHDKFSKRNWANLRNHLFKWTSTRACETNRQNQILIYNNKLLLK